MIDIGQPVPHLVGTVTDGSTLSLETLRGQWVVVYFYPKDATPGCTMEAKDFRDLAPAFAKRHAVIIGVSRDSLKSHDKFTCKHALPFALVSDTDESWCKAFDVIRDKLLYGRTFLGIVRSTFLIDPDGKLVAEWRKVKVSGHAQAVLEAIPA
ncbi:MAG TPA: peroxiredoxin [Rhodanobacteraceae bacterium]